MTWARLDDGFWCNDKVIGLSLEATGVWAKTLSWVAFHKTDGCIPSKLPSQMGWPDSAVDELVAEGLWEEAERGWLIHDYLEYNPSRAELDTSKAAQRERTAKHRDRRKREAVSEGNALRTTLRNALGNTPPDPDPDPGSQKELKPLLETEASVRALNRRPLPPVPADIPKMVPEIFSTAEPSAADLAAIRVWGIYLSTCGSAAFNKAPSAGELATCAEVVGWAASVEGVDLERATRELLRAWRSDEWVAAKKPPFTNLSRNLLERDAPKAAAEIRKQLAEEKRTNARPDAEVTERDPQLVRPSFAFIYGEGGTLDRRYDDPAAGAAYEDAVRKRKGGGGEVAKGPVDADRASGQAVVPRMVG